MTRKDTMSKAERRKLRTEKWRGWALYGKGGGVVYSGNVPSLYDNRKGAWYDGDEELEECPVEITIREMPRRKR